MKERGKRGPHATAVTLVLILLALAVIGVLWWTISNAISEGIDRIPLEKLTLDAEITGASIDDSSNNIALFLKRNSGQDEISGMSFIFYTETESEIITYPEISLEELESKQFNFYLGKLSISEVTRVSIVPIFISKSGNEVIGNIIDTYRIKGDGKDGECTPDCTGKECGTDGCWGSCGSCEDDYFCDESKICILGENPCNLTSAYWSHESIIEGNKVILNVEGTNCEGIDLHYSIYEDDGIFNSDIFSSVVVSNLTSTWIAEWSDDGGFDPDPEYYFITRVVDNPDEKITSNEPFLTVTRLSQSQTCDDQEGYICTEEESCPGTFLDATDTTRCCSDVCEEPPTLQTCSVLGGDICTEEESCPGTFLDASETRCCSDVCEEPSTLQSCSALGGETCGSGYFCNDNYLPAFDTDECCPAGNCEELTCTTCSSCESGLFTCTRQECYSCSSDNCYFISRFLSDECNSCNGATCESYDNDQTTCTDDPCNLGNCEWSGTQCIEQVPLTGDLIAYYPFTENPNDMSEYRNHGTVSGATLTTDQGGNPNSAYSFDGNNDYIQIPTSDFVISAGTIAMWVYAQGFSAEHSLFGHTSQPPWADRIQLYASDSSGNLALGLGDSHTRNTGIYDLETQTWYHIALTWQSGNYVVYVNGVEVEGASGTYTGLSSFESFADIGNTGNPDERQQAFSGKIDEVRIYNRALSQTEIAKLAEFDCTPDCAGRVCGDDTCAGTCPPGCETGESCVGGTCEIVDSWKFAVCGDTRTDHTTHRENVEGIINKMPNNERITVWNIGDIVENGYDYEWHEWQDIVDGEGIVNDLGIYIEGTTDWIEAYPPKYLSPVGNHERKCSDCCNPGYCT
jgi:hypothetical protein